MADAIVCLLLEQLISFAAEEMKEQVKLVRGVESEVKNLTSNLQAIGAVLNDAGQRQMKQESVRLWLKRLKDASYDMEDVLDEWITARRKMQIEGVEYSGLPQKKVCYFFPAPCFGFKQVFLRRDIALKIKEINENLDDIAKQKSMFNFNENVSKSDEKPEQIETTSFIDEAEISGRVVEKNTLIRKLVCEGSSEQKGPQIISLVGMGGIGKTTLARLAYNNNEVERNFDHKIWVCVSDSYDEIKIARAIIEALKCPPCNSIAFEALLQTIFESIRGKKFLLILDDMWSEDDRKWEPFCNCLKNGSLGSKILITTRKETVAWMMKSTDIISINKLAEEECWSLFQRLAFSSRSTEESEKLEEVGRKIVRKCNGLPLATKTIASLLRFKKTEEEWQYVLNSEMWEQEDLEKGLFAPLLLSYNDLPSMVKCCFSYCAIFPKDYLIDKAELVNLWMAQGYLNIKKNKDMEIIGEEYFHILATRSFFQEFKKDGDYNIRRCKMHDIVHDFAQFLSKSECFTVKTDGTLKESLINSFQMKVCHSMLQFDEGASFSISICKLRRMRSLLICDAGEFHYSSNSNILEDLFGQLTCLRALDISREGYWTPDATLIEEIPTNIEKLVHLRYINLSGRGMEKLPETLCELYNLQILDVSWCRNLKELPQGIGQLINMRHLLNDYTLSLQFLPAGMARLTNLQRLTKFVQGSQGCTIESLKNLNLLRDCNIYKLGNVSDVGQARRSELVKKKNLHVLGLYFDRDAEGERNEDDEQILEALQPPLELKELCIWKGYRGNTIFPTWMMSLTNMRSLFLSGCINCEYLPPLGKLPSLEKLSIRGMRSLKKVGNEFLGVESNNDSSSSSSSLVIAFPKLKLLDISHMNEWEEWDYGIIRIGEIMPRLSSLIIRNCPKLKVLPDHLLHTTTLQRFQIVICPILKERYKRQIGNVFWI